MAPCNTLRKASTVRDLPAVIITSLEWMCSSAWAAILSALQITLKKVHGNV